MRLKGIIAGFLAVLAMAFASPALAGPGGHGKGGWLGKHKEMQAKMAADLKLTKEQQEKMKALNEKSHPAMKEKRQAMKAAREDLHTTLKGSASDDEAKKKFEVLNKAQDDFARARFEHVLAVRAILTPEQRAKFHDIMKEHKGRGGRGDDEDGEE